VKIGNRSTSAGRGKQRWPGARGNGGGARARELRAEAPAGPTELLGGTEQFGWAHYTADVGVRLSRSRDYASPGSIPFSIRSNVGNCAI
jgi:hypothetical protein